MPSNETEPPIGSRGVLLHVGPHKTGTSALQGGLAASHDVLLRHGVTVVGTTAEQHHAARAVTRHSSTRGMKRIDDRHWTDLAASVQQVRGRAVISSELFDVATDDVISRIVDDLGPDRLHVAVTAVPLSSLMPSAWQQRIRSGYTVALDDWLRDTLEAHGRDEPARFWRRHRLDHVLTRWAATIGPDRVHLVIGDKERKRQILEMFEQLLGVPDGTIVNPAWSTNRSMRRSEAELVRRVNTLAETAKWSPATHARFLRMGASHELTLRHRPGPEDPPISLPAWAHAPVHDIAASIVEGIERTGVHVMGDLDTLLAAPARVEDPQTPGTISIEAAAHAVIGAARGGGAGILREKHVEPADLRKYPGVSSATTDLLKDELRRRGDLPELTQLPSDQLTAELRRRAKRRLRRVLGR